MTKCTSYCEEKERHYYTDYEKGYLDAKHIPHEDFEYRTISKCNGTKERDVCDCGGNPLNCSFYPEKRILAIRETFNSKADRELLFQLRTNMTSITRYVFNEKEDRSAEYRELAKEAVNNILLLINGEKKK